MLERYLQWLNQPVPDPEKRKLLFLKVPIAVTGVALGRNIAEDLQPARGEQGLPWGSADEIVRGLWDSAFDKYDALDRFVNGRRARSSYWKSTKDWLKEVCKKALLETGSPAWTGFCRDAAAGMWFAPVIRGDLPVAGITFSEEERQKIATFSYGGLLRYPEYSSCGESAAEIEEWIRDGWCVAVNRSPVPYQDWWGVVTGIDKAGRWIVSRPTTGRESGLQKESKYPYQLWNAAVLQTTDTPHPGFEGNFVVINRDVGGLIIGT